MENGDRPSRQNAAVKTPPMSKPTNMQKTDEEIFDVVDAADNVLMQLPRSVVHDRRLLHRAVHIFLLNSQGEFLLHLRSQFKDQYPLCYTSSASGHLNAGEDYAAAASRELKEELSLETDLQLLAKFPASVQTSYEHTVLYLAISDETLVIDPRETSAVEFCSVAEVQRRLEHRPELFSPALVVLWNWFTRFHPLGKQP